MFDHQRGLLQPAIEVWFPDDFAGTLASRRAFELLSNAKTEESFLMQLTWQKEGQLLVSEKIMGKLIDFC